MVYVHYIHLFPLHVLSSNTTIISPRCIHIVSAPVHGPNIQTLPFGRDSPSHFSVAAVCPMSVGVGAGRWAVYTAIMDISCSKERGLYLDAIGCAAMWCWDWVKWLNDVQRRCLKWEYDKRAAIRFPIGLPHNDEWAWSRSQQFIEYECCHREKLPTDERWSFRIFKTSSTLKHRQNTCAQCHHVYPHLNLRNNEW